MDQKMMAEAICEARKALAHKDVPIGAVVALDGEIIGRGHNTRERDHDPSGHAEINAMRDAAQTLDVLFLKPGGHVPGRNCTEQENRLHHSL